MKNIMIGLGAAVALAAGVFAVTAINVITKPAQLVNEVASTNNILSSYSDFYDTKNAFDARLDNIADLKGADDMYSKQDLNGARQACRELATRYNSSSQKMTTKFFKGSDLPETLNLEECNA